ncbi:MAG TPA: NAD(P)-dependent oxidoreductase [Candidatus Saccharimonadales bacterium]|nr:NAD(P)-dependent oxidoreductase [Candidatus Saccharimonadales bacterium]
MDDSTFFIVGANGQLGQALQAKYPNAKTADVSELDITDAESIKNYDWSNISVILNAAAYTNVDGAETDGGKKAAWAVNADGVANLAKAASEHDLTLVHISTEYVFDGTESPHTEDEPASPLSEYGKSKAAGDEQAAKAPKHYIIRVSWLIGEGNNFVRTMLGLGKKGINPTVVADQVGRLTFTTELVRGIDHLLSTHAEYGTYNLTNEGTPASWAEITRAIFTDAGSTGLTVSDTTTAGYFADKPEAAKRPLQSTLALDKIEATGFKPVDWHEDLKQYVEKELAT